MAIDLDTGKQSFGFRHLHPQSLNDCSTYAKYLRRALDEQITDRIRDQEVLHDIHAFKIGNVDKLVEGFFKRRAYAYVAASFLQRRLIADLNFSTVEKQALASNVFAKILQAFGSSASAEKSSGFMALSTIANREIDKEWINWVVAEVRKAIPISINFCIDIAYWWTSTSGAAFPLDSERLFELIAVEASSTFNHDGAEKLINALSKDHPYSICHLIAPPRAKELNLNSIELASQWQWFAPILLKASHERKSLIMPQLIVLSASRVNANDDEKPHRASGRVVADELNLALINAVFALPAQRNELMRLISDPGNVDFPEDQMTFAGLNKWHDLRRMITTVPLMAREWLEKNEG